MLDIDVIGPDKKPVNRLAMGYAPRTCLVCGAPAKFCIATRAHTKEELAAEIEKMAKVAEAAL
jgi:phosphoribosyl-dephospho-CoA transferase